MSPPSRRSLNVSAIVNKAVSSRSSIQVLSGVLVDAREDGTTLSATDMEISIKAPLARAGRTDRAHWCVPARIATDIARSLPAGAVIIEQTPGETQVQIQAGESLFDLHSLPAADFPQLPTLVGDRFTVGRVAFVETVDRVAPSASRDETRPVLTGVLVQFAKRLGAHGRDRQLPLERERDPCRVVADRHASGHRPGAHPPRAFAYRGEAQVKRRSPSCPPRIRCSSRSAE